VVVDKDTVASVILGADQDGAHNHKEDNNRCTVIKSRDLYAISSYHQLDVNLVTIAKCIIQEIRISTLRWVALAVSHNLTVLEALQGQLTLED